MADPVLLPLIMTDKFVLQSPEICDKIGGGSGSLELIKDRRGRKALHSLEASSRRRRLEGLGGCRNDRIVEKMCFLNVYVRHCSVLHLRQPLSRDAQLMGCVTQVRTKLVG
jgi:hypothetical protein